MMSMPKDERVDLLLQLFMCQLMVISHPEVFFDGIIFTRRDIDWMVSTIA